MSYIEKNDPRNGKVFRVLDKDGKVVNKSAEPKLKKEDLFKLYEYMILTRVADEKAIKLQRSGRMGTFAQSSGQEAQVGIALAMKKEDWLFPSFREHGAMMLRGMPPELFYMVFMGNEEGNRMPENVNNFTVSVPVGSQALHAVGSAWASKIKKEKDCTVGFFGDGATSEGDFHEAMNFAGVFNVPCVLVCQNNQYAISLPVKNQTATDTIAEKAYAYGFDGVKVDGNDVLGLYVIAREALEKARKGNGPTLIEAFTYRMGPHTSADDPTIYREDKEVKKWKEYDPIERFRKYLLKKKYWNKKYEEKVLKWAEQKVDDAVKKAESTKLGIDDMFKYMYKEMPDELKDQLNYLKSMKTSKGEGE
ncbi:MAG: pyruvate dehydrogenase (acetyl-transferring) E1 component subunit alpha [Nanoarchaeota archaeon]|nr:pyruvate dehydrogenase (acetyl-transferring) E1 component subunit alpha [Nanoarchaeota archaeon]